MKYTTQYPNIDPAKILMVEVGDAFDKAWKENAPEQADPAELREPVVDGIAAAIDNDPETLIRLPEISISTYKDKLELSITDGRHRIAALRKTGHLEVPMIVETDMERTELLKLPFVREVPENLLHEIMTSGQEEKTAFPDDAEGRAQVNKWLNSVREKWPRGGKNSGGRDS